MGIANTRTCPRCGTGLCLDETVRAEGATVPYTRCVNCGQYRYGRVLHRDSPVIHPARWRHLWPLVEPQETRRAVDDLFS